MQAKYSTYLEIIGVGYKANTDVSSNYLYLKLGFSHDIKLKIPPSVRVFCLKPTFLCCVGTDLNIVTQFAATIRKQKVPEVYKGKGIRYRNEIIVLKQGKKK